MAPDELAEARVKVDTARHSIGIEHIDDLLANPDLALAAVQWKGRGPSGGEQDAVPRTSGLAQRPTPAAGPHGVGGAPD